MAGQLIDAAQHTIYPVPDVKRLLLWFKMYITGLHPHGLKQYLVYYAYDRGGVAVIYQVVAGLIYLRLHL
ncbi:hypothetical protein MBAV_000925 [Candidatus Magnetobacterium bavaricum]|uniref:Uncharacterized protein n=1 Tax=Candidatus Magnetobacterium bavaricum TaxID=29290 RepID=A0A0F3GYA5_9BACT|nr:hypothetical protein MBAV_000925 [Candidatus Magnetobacterium bavaricum]